MGKLGLVDWARWLVLKRAIPTKRRRAKWGAERQFQLQVRRLTHSDIAIDCGANLGEYTRALAGTGATVYAFEPDPYCFDVLLKTVGRLPNVKLFDQAVGAEPGEAKLYRTKDFAADPGFFSQSSSVYGSKRNADASNVVMVQQIDLTAFIDALPRRVSVLKLDVEGAEVPVIEKLLDTHLIDKIDYLFAETHERQIPDLAARTQALRSRISTESRSNLNLDWG